MLCAGNPAENESLAEESGRIFKAPGKLLAFVGDTGSDSNGDLTCC